MNSKAIILIGVSQSGKSTFGNMLCNDNIQSRGQINEIFKTGGANKSKTKSIKCVSKVYENNNYDIIDTPGLGDSEERDIDFFQKILFKIKEGIDLSCIILVINRNILITSEQKKSLEMYKCLFGEYFNTNLIIVVTKITENDVYEFELKNKTVEDYLRGLKKTLEKELMINQNIPMYGVNALPLSDLESINCKKVRDNIFIKTTNNTTISINTRMKKPLFF